MEKIKIAKQVLDKKCNHFLATSYIIMSVLVNNSRDTETCTDVYTLSNGLYDTVLGQELNHQGRCFVQYVCIDMRIVS